MSAGASNSAKLLLRSANDQHPNGLANGSDQVGRNYMFHNCKAIVALAKEPNDTVFQKTVGLNDFYFGAPDYDWPAGNIQMVGKSNAEAMKGEEPKLTKLAPHLSLAEVARHAVDFWLTTEDLPKPDNRVTVDGDGNIHLAYTSTNDDEADRLYHELKKLLNHVGLAQHHVLDKNFYMHMDISVAGVAHQAGTCRFGTDPATSVLDADCKAHELDNLYVVDTSFFPSIGAVNPALTAMANAIRVGEHLTAAARLSATDADGHPHRDQRRLRRRARPGHRPGHVPGGQHDLHRPDEYDLSSSQYGAMFLPQVDHRDRRRRCSAPAWPRRYGIQARLPRRADGQPRRRWALLVASTPFTDDHAVAYALLLVATAFLGVGFGLTVPTLNTFTAAFHPDGGRPVRPRAQRPARARHRAGPALRRDLRRPRLLVGAAGAVGDPARRAARRQPSAAAAHRQPAAPATAAAARRSRAGSGCSPRSPCSTASARR